VTINGQETVLETINETLLAAQAAWTETEAAIRTKTRIFGELSTKPET
jgi:hypothetical protein